MIEKIIKKSIPSQLSLFDKFKEGHDPYHFAAWDKDSNITILRYWFWNKAKTKKYRKRVFINELEELLKHSLISRSISRKEFKKYCPRTSSDGSCGFAVIIGILKHIDVVDIVDGQYTIKNVERLQHLLNI